MTSSVFLLALLASVVSQTPDWTQIPVASTYTSLESPPAGCSCADTSSPCTSFDCKCTCNLHSLMCDANCCCDPDCSSDEVMSYRSAASCLPEGPPNRTLTTCTSAYDYYGVLYINPKTRCVAGGVYCTYKLVLGWPPWADLCWGGP
jgi:hypothetical protein